MAFIIVDLETADVIAEFDALEDAEAGLAVGLEQGFVIVEIDVPEASNGHVLWKPEPGHATVLAGVAFRKAA